MGKKLTPEEWSAIKPPFHWIKIKDNASKVEVEIVNKWLDQQCGGWWYDGASSGSSGTILYVFESPGDMVAFKLWLTTNPFDQESGGIS